MTCWKHQEENASYRSEKKAVLTHLSKIFKELEIDATLKLKDFRRYECISYSVSVGAHKIAIFAKKFNMADAKEKQKLQSIMLDLNSGDSKKMMKAIKALEKNGDSSVIKPVVEILMNGLPEKQQSSLIELLCSLKDTSVVVEMMEVLEDEKFLPARQMVLSAIWNMKIDFSGYIDDFVYIATVGDFMEALDCLTIIENLEGPFLEEDILECQLHLKNYMESNPPHDEQRSHILSEIALLIKEINMNLDD